MSDVWVPGPPPVPSPPIGGLPPANSWNPAAGCSTSPDNPSIASGVLITGVPALIASISGGAYVWSITLNDGGSPAAFTIDHYDASGVLIDHPLEFSGANGAATFNDPVFMPAATAASLEITAGPLVVPDVAQFIMPGGPPGTYLGSLGGSGGNLTWFQPPIAADAPSDGQIYARQNGGWEAINVTPGDFLPLAGGTLTGGIFFNGTQPNRFVAGMTSGSMRWALNLGDSAAESGSNAGSNFTLQSFSDAGAPLGTPLVINRQTNLMTLSGGVGTPILALNGTASGAWKAIAGMTSGSLRWTLYLGDPSGELGNNLGSNFRLDRYTDAGVSAGTALSIARSTGVATFSSLPSFPGGTLNYVLATNGAGVLAWAPPGVAEAPNDGTLYGRQSAAWSAAATPASVTSGDAAVTSAFQAADATLWQNIRYRNRIINGDMSVDQRHGGVQFAMPAGKTYVIDRWYFNNPTAVPSKGNIGQSAIGDPTMAALFSYSTWVNVVTAAYTPVAADRIAYWQNIEAINFQDAQWGTPQAQPVVLEFWANASVAGTYAVGVNNYAATRSYVATFTLPAAAWTKVRLNIPGDTGGTWTVASSNAPMAGIVFPLCVGSTYQTSTPNTWLTGNFQSAVGAVNVFGALNNQLNITGVALMVGAAAANAEPEFRKYSDNLIDCQRYFLETQLVSGGYQTAGSQMFGSVSFPTTMRTAPTFTMITNGSNNVSTPTMTVTTYNSGMYGGGAAAVTGACWINYLFTADADF